MTHNNPTSAHILAQAPRCNLLSSPRCIHRIQTISYKPRAMVYHNFLSDRECRHIIDLAHAQVAGRFMGSWTGHRRYCHSSWM